MRNVAFLINQLINLISDKNIFFQVTIFYGFNFSISLVTWKLLAL